MQTQQWQTGMMKRKAALEVRSEKQFKEELKEQYNAAVKDPKGHPKRPNLKAVRKI